MALSSTCAGSAPECFLTCPLRSSSSSGVVLFFRWLAMSLPTVGADMLPRDPDFFGEPFQFRLSRARLPHGGEFDPNPKDRALVAGRSLDIGSREPSLNQLRRQPLGGLLIGGGQKLGEGG